MNVCIYICFVRTYVCVWINVCMSIGTNQFIIVLYHRYDSKNFFFHIDGLCARSG